MILPADRRPRQWIWFFVLLVVVAAVAVTTPWIINVRQQLKSDELARARALWRERGPRDYDLEYRVRINVEQGEDTFQVEVRSGKVTSARCNGQPTTETVLTIDTMFDFMEKMLQEDRNASLRPYTVAAFDSADGHPRRYVRRVRGTHDRLEWRVRLNALTTPQ